MTHIVFFDAIWPHIYRYLTSSAPSDGRIHDIKCWVISNITEPVLEVMYRLGLTTYKPIVAFTPEDLLPEDFVYTPEDSLELLEQDRDES